MNVLTVRFIKRIETSRKTTYTYIHAERKRKRGKRERRVNAEIWGITE